MSRALIPVGQRLTQYGVPKSIGLFMSDTQKVIAYLMGLFLPLDLIPTFLSLIGPSIPTRSYPRPPQISHYYNSPVMVMQNPGITYGYSGDQIRRLDYEADARRGMRPI